MKSSQCCTRQKLQSAHMEPIHGYFAVHASQQQREYALNVSKELIENFTARRKLGRSLAQPDPCDNLLTENNGLLSYCQHPKAALQELPVKE